MVCFNFPSHGDFASYKEPGLLHYIGVSKHGRICDFAAQTLNALLAGP